MGLTNSSRKPAVALARDQGGLIRRPARVAFLGSLRAEERRCHREPRQLHTAATAAPIPAAVLGPNLVVPRRIGRIWGSGLAHGPLGAPGERQDDEERGKLPMQVHPFPPAFGIVQKRFGIVQKR
jgi:hypothetical protein